MPEIVFSMARQQELLMGNKKVVFVLVLCCRSCAQLAFPAECMLLITDSFKDEQ